MTSSKIIAVTGHRPERTGGYSSSALDALDQFAYSVLLGLRTAEPGLRILSGLALGWDQAIAVAAHTLDIPVVGAIPFHDHDRRWMPDQRRRYEKIREQCERIECICEGLPAKWKYQKRNEWLVDHSDELLALWDGTASGTGNCVAYAQSKKKRITNVWNLWVNR